MKKKIYKILSLLLVLAVLVTTCAHGNWFVTDAADESYVLVDVHPTMESGTLSQTTSGFISTNSARIRTSNYLSIDDCVSISIASGYKLAVHSYTANSSASGTHTGYDSGWQSSLNISQILASKSNSKYFKIVVKNDAGTNFSADSLGDALTVKMKVHNSELTDPEMAQGAPDAGNSGYVNVSNIRVYTRYLIPISEYTTVNPGDGFAAWYHFYNAEGVWIGSYTSDGGWLSGEREISTLAKGFSSAVYFKMAIKESTGANISPETYSGLTLKSVNSTPDYSQYYEDRGNGLKNTFAKFNNGTADTLNVVYMGGSVTVGADISAEELEEKSWRALTTKWLEDNSNGDTINSINAAYGETGSLFGAYRLGPEVLPLQPHLVFLEFSVNDLYDHNNRNSIDEAAAKMQYESIIRGIREEYPDCDIVTVLITDENIVKDGNEGLHDFAKYHDKVSEHYSVPSIYVGLALEAQLSSKTSAGWDEVSVDDIVHPNEKGHKIYADCVNAYFESQKTANAGVTTVANHTQPAQLSETLINPDDIEYIAPSQELLNRSVELGGSGFYFAPEDGYDLDADKYETGTKFFKTGFGSKTENDVFVIEFTGTALAIIEQRDEVQNILVKIDDANEWTTIKRDDVKTLFLAENLTMGKHVVRFKPDFKTDVADGNRLQTSGFFVVKGEDNSQEYFAKFEPGALSSDGNEVADSTTCKQENGEYTCSHEYIRMVDMLPIASYQGIKVSNEYQMWVYVYDAVGNYIGATTDWVNTAYSTTTMIDQFTVNGVEPTYFQAYFRKNPDVATTTTIEHEDIFLIDEGDIAILAKEVVEEGKEDLELNVPTDYPTIEAAVDYALSREYGKNDTVILNVTGNIPWVADNAADSQITSHAFKLVINGDIDGDGVADGGVVYANEKSINKNIHMGGDVEIKNITLKMAVQYDMLFFKNNNVSLEENVNIVYGDDGSNSWPIISFGNYKSEENKSNVYKNTIQAEIKAKVKEIYLSNYNGPSMVYGDMHVHYDNAKGNPIFYLGPKDEDSSTVYNAGIDMIIDAASSITFKNTNNVRFGLGGFLQVLNNTNAEIDNQVALDNASSVWIVNNRLPENERDNIQFTGYKGIYTVKGNKKVYVYKGDQQVAESRNGQINLAVLGAGIYTLKYEGEYSVVTYVPKPDGENGATTDTIAGLIEQAISKESTDTQELYKQVYIDLSNVTSIDYGNWNTITENHNFEVIVWSDNNDVVVNIPSGTQLKGSMTFDSVKLDCESENGKLYLNGNDCTITETCEIIDFTNICTGTTSGGTFEQKKNSEGIVLDGSQVVDIAAQYSGTVTLGSAVGNAAYGTDYDLNLVINNSQSTPTVNATATFGGDLNINVKRAKTVNIDATSVTQLIRQENAKVTLNNTTLNGSTSDATYYIIDKSYNTGCIDCTETPGTYTSNTEFIITATHDDKTVITSVDDVLTLNNTGKWTLTTTDYFEDFKGMSTAEIEESWSANGLVPYTDEDVQNYGTWKYENEKIHITSTGYLISNNGTTSIFTNKNISSSEQFISVDFKGSRIVSSNSRSTALTDTKTNGNIRDNGAGVSLFARLDLTDKQAYELKIARNRVILTKRDGDGDGNDTTRPNEAGRPGSNADYKVVLYSGNTYKAKFDTIQAYKDEYARLQNIANNDGATEEQKKAFNDFKGYEKRYLMASCDFDVAHLTSYMHYNRFPESYDEGNAININEDHIYRLGMSVVDGGTEVINGEEKTIAYVRILLLDVTTNRLVVDETFKDLEAENFGGDKFGFGVDGNVKKNYGGADDRFCEADFDNVWFSTERFRGGDMGELNDINYDSYFDVRDLVRVYEYMGGANARINFNAADRDYNGYITTFDESEVRKELLHGAGDSFRLVGQREDAADELRNDIVNMGVTGEGSGIVERDGKKWYYPDLSQTDSEVSYLAGREIKGNVYYVSSEATEPEDVTFKPSEKWDDSTVGYWLESGRIDKFSRYELNNKYVRSKYFLNLDEDFKLGISGSKQIQCFLYDEDFNYLGRTESLAAQNNQTLIMDYTYLNNSANLQFKSQQVDKGYLDFAPVYVKFHIVYSGELSLTGALVNLVTSDSYTISGYDYHKLSTGTQENPWTFRQFQLYGDSAQLIGSENVGTDANANWVTVRNDPFKIINGTETPNDGDDSVTDAVLFKRGNEFLDIKQMQVVCLADQVPASYAAFFAQTGVLYGAYGTGEKPVLNASAKNYASADADGKSLWTKVDGKDIYYCDVNDITQYDNNRDNAVLNVIFNKGAKIGTRKFFAEDLHTLYKEGQYATDVENGLLYLYCEDKAPDKKYNQIYMTRCLYGGYINIGASDIVVDNINFYGFGGGGLRGAFNCPRNTIQNCEISYSGGMLHPVETFAEFGYSDKYDKKYGLRYGNGVETWENSNDFIIDHNWIYHTFDSAVSPQGDGDSTGDYDGFAITNNIFEYNNCDVEYFDDATPEETILKNVDISNNIFRFTSFGWGTRESDKIRGIQGVLRMDLRADEYIDIDFTDNLIDTPGMEIFTIKNYNLGNKQDSQYQGPFYKFGFITDLTANPTDHGKTSELSDNKYYYNYYVRNYPYISTGYLVDSDTTYNESSANRKADSDDELAQNLAKIDSTGTFYWYSTQVNP